jgi:hypothetical protein
MRRLTRLTLSTVLAVAALAAVTGTAIARSPVSDLQRTGKSHTTSTNWSGYAVFNGTFSDVKGTFVVPAADCSGVKGQQLTMASPWVGLDGYSNGTVEQTGTDSDCIGHTASYRPWYEFYPDNSIYINQTVSANDVMNVEVSHSGSTTTVFLQDVTRGWSNTATSTLSFGLASAEWILEAPASKLTKFNTPDQFSNATATDGTHSNAPISAFGSQNTDAITLVGKGHGVRATPSGLGGDGKSFTVTWNNY